MKHPLSQTWDLDVFFPGGSDSSAFKTYLESIEDELSQIKQRLEEMKAKALPNVMNEFIHLLMLLQEVSRKLKHSESFTACLAAQNQNDRKAVILSGRVSSLKATYMVALTSFEDEIVNATDAEWTHVLDHAEMQSIRFVLDERRQWAKQKLPPDQEALIADLAVDGYHGWGDYYNNLVSQVTIEMGSGGKQERWSAGQAANKLSDPDRTFRSALFERWELAWKEQEHLFADTLNRLAGFRLQVYKHRGWEDVLQEPLHLNRCSAATLKTMWDVIERNKAIFLQYLDRKAALLDVEQLAWHDVEAPIGSATKTFTYDEATDLIVEQFRTFSPKLAEFTEMAFEQRWIEAEDRSDKRPGGFCTGFPAAKQTRIFMTYAGTASNVATLAHELGHAFHQYVMEDLPEFNQDYAMNVAETASTFAEMIVADATVRAASNKEEKLTLLEDKIQRSVAFYMNIHARFIFEQKMYATRKQGLLSAEDLSALMLEAQQEAFVNRLSSYHPRFWASKLHFYLTDVPFYNFPYTFGYLFSAGIYAKALDEGTSFEDKYIDLLRDTGRMNVEDLAMKHLGVDLTQPDFWQMAMDLTIQDVESFLSLTQKMQ